MATTYELIASNVLSSDTASVTFSSISQAYDDLLIMVSARSTRSAVPDEIKIRFNGATDDSNLSNRRLGGSGSSTDSATQSSMTLIIPGASATADTFGSSEIYISNYAGSAAKSMSATSTTENNATESYIRATAGLWNITSSITSIGFTLQNGPNFKSGSSFYLYGIKRSS